MWILEAWSENRFGRNHDIFLVQNRNKNQDLENWATHLPPTPPPPKNSQLLRIPLGSKTTFWIGIRARRHFWVLVLFISLYHMMTCIWPVVHCTSQLRMTLTYNAFFSSVSTILKMLQICFDKWFPGIIFKYFWRIYCVKIMLFDN